MGEILVAVVALLAVVLAIALLFAGVKIVPQSAVYVVERFGKYTSTLDAGMSFIVPVVYSVAHKISILERQLPEFKISVITRDNVEVVLEATVFFRIVDASRSVYRIDDVDLALHTAATSIVRSAAGQLDLDELQSARESMNREIAENLQQAAEVWGIEITRTEITEIIIDELTKEAQRQQLNAERQRRAAIATAEGEKQSVQLAADARLYEAEKEAEATRLAADADAYAIRAKAEADAEQTRLIALAIADNGQPAINFEIMKRQVDALSMVASGESSKTVIVPTDVVGAIGSIETLLQQIDGNRSQ